MKRTNIAEAVRLILAVSAATLVCGHAFAQEQDAAGASEVVAADADDGAEEIVVTGRQRSAASEIVEERIEQEVVVDLLGAEQISRVGDSNVSLALRRMPGVTLVSDQFIYIRGLGERYSSTTLNGAYVPSPDLTRNVIPLDLFPAEIIQSLAVNKGYTADMPAAFGGGNVDIRTMAIPEEFVMDFQIGSGWHSNSSDKALTYQGGDDDWLGRDDGTRKLPTAVNQAIQDYQGDLGPVAIQRALNRDGQPHTHAEAQQINRQLAASLYRDVDVRESSTDPDITFEGTMGNSWYFGAQEDWRFGVVGLIDYGNQWRNRARINRQMSDPENLSFETRRSTNQVSLTGSLAMGVDFANEHNVEVTGMYLRNTEDETAVSVGNNGNFQRVDGRQLRTTRLRYEERDLELLQVRGTHTLGDTSLELLGGALGFMSWEWARDLSFSWYSSDATAQTDIPSELAISQQDIVDPVTGSVLATSVRASGGAAEYRFTDLHDEVLSDGWSLSKPWTIGDVELKLTGGADHYRKARQYLQTQLSFGAASPASGDFLSASPSDVFSDANLLDPANGFELSLGGLGTESYLAAERVDAAFIKFDANWNDTWRFSGGIRHEDFKQISVPVNQHEFDTNVGKIPVPADQLPNLVKTEDDYYPSFALTYMRPDFWAEQFQLRFGWSETVTRPDLREISPAYFIDPLTDVRVRGNPDLLTSRLTNFDLRAEWFFGDGDSFTLSPFYKEIENPIESVEGPGADDNVFLTFINAQTAEVYGVEIEALKGLDFLAGTVGDWVSGFFIAGNVTLSDSELNIGPNAVGLTNSSRRMTQHSEYLVNLQLGYDSPGEEHTVSVAYNTFGERIFYTGRNGSPDAYEQPFHSLDLVYSWFPTDVLSMRLRVQNLLDESVQIEQGGVTRIDQEVGATVKVDVQIKF